MKVPRTDLQRVSDAEVFEAVRLCLSKSKTGKFTMLDVANAAGLTRVQIYNRFGSRSALINKFLLSHSRAWKRQLVSKLFARGINEDAVTSVLIKSLEAIETDHFFQMFFSPEIGFNKQNSNSVLELGREHWGGILQQGIEQGIFRPDLDLLETSDWLTLTEISLLNSMRNFGKTLDQCEAYVRCFIQPALLASTRDTNP